jgi:NDP-sugar pyrophosphorylase family protein
MTLDDCQLVILAGGLGTRLGAATANTAKSMVEVGGKPFLQHQIELVKSRGIKQVLLLTGHLGEQIEGHFGDGSKFGIDLKYSRETEPLGTAGALKLAEPLLQRRFLMMYGDAYLTLDYGLLWDRQSRSVRQAVMVIYKNENRWGRSNVVYDLPVVACFDPTAQSLPSDHASRLKPHQRFEYIDYGITAIKKELIEALPAGTKGSMNEVFAGLAAKRQLDGLEVKERFYEIGSPEGLEAFKAYLKESSQ